MNQEKDKVVTSSTKNEGYCKLNDINNEIYKTLSIMNVCLRRITNKKTSSTRYVFEFKVGQLPILDAITAEKYYHILTIKRNIDAPEHYQFQVRYRYIKGLDKNGSEFRQIQFVIGEGCYITHLFSKQQSMLIDVWEKQNVIPEINYVDKPEGLDDEFIDKVSDVL